MPVSAFAFDEGTKTDNAFSRSVVDESQLVTWQDQDDVAAAELMGATIMNTVTEDGTQVDLTMFGVEPEGFLAPEVSSGERLSGPAGIVVSETARGEGLEVAEPVARAGAVHLVCLGGR